MKARNITEKIMSVIFIFCGMISIVAVVGISAYMIISGLPAQKEIGISKFLFGQVWKSTASEPLFGILPFILSSIFMTIPFAALEAQNGMKPSRLGANYKFLLHCT